MRTTIDLPDDTYRQLKAKAALEGCSVKEIVLRMVNRELVSGKKTRRGDLPVIGKDTGRKVNLTGEEIDEAMFS